MGETKKVQLAVRVPADVRDLCLELARKVGVSKNVFVEKLIRAAAQAPNPHAPLEIPLVEPLDADEFEERIVAMGLDAEQAREIRERADIAGQAIVASVTDAPAKPFAANCKAGTLHWKHGPGNPCRFCDGEI